MKYKWLVQQIDAGENLVGSPTRFKEREEAIKWTQARVEEHPGCRYLIYQTFYLVEIEKPHARVVEVSGRWFPPVGEPLSIKKKGSFFEEYDEADDFDPLIDG